MPIGPLLLFGVIFIVGGLYNLYGQDSLWESQVHVNEMNGIPESRRTDAWENQRAGIGGLGVLMGGIFLGLAALSIFGGGASPTAQRPIGQYSCLLGEAITSGEFLVTIDPDGKGTYKGQPLTWTYDGVSRVLFGGDVSAVSGQFVGSDPLNEFVMADNDGIHSCVTRSR